MALWTNTPPANDTRRSFKLLRCPPGGKIKAVIINNEPVGALLHYWKGRTTPCDKIGCDACVAGHAPRWKGYLLGWASGSGRLAIIEYTERIHPEIARHHAINNGLRGSRIEITRLGTKPNSPLHCDFEGKVTNLDQLPEEVNIMEMLERMWEIAQQPLPFALDDHRANGKAQRNGKPTHLEA